jgi:hypothetical protein
MQFLANLGFKDSRRLIERLSQEAAVRVEREIEALLPRLPVVAAEATRRALPFLRLLLPAAASTSFELGKELVQLPMGEQRAKAIQRILANLGERAKEFLLRALFDLALNEFKRLLADHDLLWLVQMLDEENRVRISDALKTARDVLVHLDSIEQAALEDWLAAVMQLLLSPKCRPKRPDRVFAHYAVPSPHPQQASRPPIRGTARGDLCTLCSVYWREFATRLAVVGRKPITWQTGLSLARYM